MDPDALPVRAAFALLVGLGFVAPTAGALFELAGLGPSAALPLGVLVGAAVGALVLRGGRWEA